MPNPNSDITMRKVVGSWGEWDSDTGTRPARGHVQFTPSNYIIDTSDNSVIIRSSLKAVLDKNGEIEIELPVTDDPDHSPSDWFYWVTERVEGQAFRTYHLTLPEAPTEFDLSTIQADSPPPTPESEYLLQSDPRVPLNPDSGQHGQAVIVGTDDNLTFGDVVTAVGDKDNPISDPDYPRPPGAGPRIWFTNTHINTAEPQDVIVRVDRAINL